jgi:hypothetical protein
MTIATTQLAMGFQSANSRPACRNCIHGDESYADRMPPYNTKTWRCSKGGFGTTAMAICKQHQPKNKGGAKP